ncbi:Hypothetical Protein FCC1311_037642 [Hondaea fermentalgiana]|uniref:Uncharacterized protein n=1 Tax=Hondaea fermentalgiana TaxID=2315210 RepID=A0A2R5GGZ5_9STRA|nr:Hypothetical Protein FCC1311_037642 [Hondaea fermentalgiana]|eukprot:GBG27541.1 Hypothetical Protein FCC1311_037642 [Hondaea fermentalgiana]
MLLVAVAGMDATMRKCSRVMADGQRDRLSATLQSCTDTASAKVILYMSSARSNGLKPNGPGAKSSAKEVAATLANLEAAEALLHAVLEHTESAVEHIESRSLGQRVNLPQLSKTGDNLISTLDEVHDRLSREIPNLVKYVPFERSSYGKKKDAAIAQGKLDFARNHLARTLELIDEPSPTEGAVTAPNQT